MQSPSITILMKALSKESNASYFYFPNGLLSFINFTTTIRIVIRQQFMQKVMNFFLNTCFKWIILPSKVVNNIANETCGGVVYHKKLEQDKMKGILERNYLLDLPEYLQASNNLTQWGLQASGLYYLLFTMCINLLQQSPTTCIHTIVVSYCLQPFVSCCLPSIPIPSII